MKCPLCQSESKFVFEAKGFPVRDCTECGHRFAEVLTNENHVSQIYDDSYFTGGGAGYSDYLAEGEMLRRRGGDYAKILSEYTETGKMLDVGAAAGFVLKGFVEKGWSGVGIEPNLQMAKFGAENLNLEILNGDLENFQKAEKFDLISMIQVVAHFHEPRRAFQNAADLLEPNGFLLVETWNRASLTARIFGRNWHEYSPPSVLQWFSRKGLSGFLIEEFGFKELAVGRPSKKISGEHAKSLLKYRLGEKFSALLKIVPDKINFPYPAEDLFWAIYQKNG
jgi:SAM-dependent methyltransferase